MKRIICPFHKEDTPSMVVYPEAAYCFGCGKKAKLEEVGETYDGGPKKMEDIDQTLVYIDSLDVEIIRGLLLPADELFYYLVWPKGKYYIKRFKHDIEVNSKYICPKGHKRPLFNYGGGGILIIIEGELNAASIFAALDADTDYIRYTIVSPGGATGMLNYLTEYLKYDNIKIIADLDKAGVSAGLMLEDELIKRGKKVEHFFFEEDANDILVKYGPEEIRKRYNLEM